VQEIDGQLYHVSVEFVEPHELGTEVFPFPSLFGTNLRSSSPSENLHHLPGLSATHQSRLRLVIHKMSTYTFPQQPTHQQDDDRCILDACQNKMSYYRPLSVSKWI
jgi:hypothetical protein